MSEERYDAYLDTSNPKDRADVARVVEFLMAVAEGQPGRALAILKIASSVLEICGGDAREPEFYAPERNDS